jgi:hypothetical protein
MTVGSPGLRRQERLWNFEPLILEVVLNITSTGPSRLKRHPNLADLNAAEASLSSSAMRIAALDRTRSR